MKLLIAAALLLFLWVAYEFWRAPLLEETEDGGWIIKKPAKKLSDLWRKLF
jgi:hypothetical protein